METVEQMSAETLDMIRKAQTSGVLTSTGIQGVDLSGVVALVPVNVPARNNTQAFPRQIAGEGSQTAVWRSLTNINAQQSDAAVGFDFAGSMTLFDEQDVFAPYKPLAKAGRVTLDAIAVARNYADSKAIATLQTLNQLFIDQDLHIINSQNWSLGVPATPTLAAQGTGGSIGAATDVFVRVAARSGANYFIGGNSVASVENDVTTGGGATNAVAASIPAVQGAVAYDWYVSDATGTEVYYTTTTVSAVLITSIPVSANALPKLPLLSATAPSPTPPAVDTSFSDNWYNGVIASSLGDYGATGPVTPGAGNPSGATFIDNGGNAPQLSGGGIDVLDNINDSLWASVQLSPTAYMVNSEQADEISRLILSSSSALTFLPPTDADARTNLAGGGYIGRYINRSAGGVAVNIEVHPRVAPGTIIARTDRVPFPGSNIGSVYEVRCQYDTMQFDYAANYNPGNAGGGPRYDFEIRSMETLVNRAPVAQAVCSNVG